MIHGWSACGGPTIVRTTRDWEAELRGWLEPFLERLGHKARRRMCPLYVAGLIGPGDRKSVQPMAERFAPNDYDQLHHFIAGGVWDSAPLERELLIQADKLVGGSDAVLVIDDTAVPKKGKRSVGVASQICFGAWQEPQLPDAGITDARTRRSPSDGGVAPFSSRELDRRPSAVEARRRSARISNDTY